MGFHSNTYRNFTKGDKDPSEEEVTATHKAQDKTISTGNGDRHKVTVPVSLESCSIFIFMCLVVLSFILAILFFTQISVKFGELASIFMYKW